MSALQSYHFAWLAAHPERSEEWLRGKLREGFHVHHIDFDHSNDAPSNLALVFGADHLANLHGWKQHKRKPRPAPTAAVEASAAEPAPQLRPRRAYANPAGFKRDPAAFIAWQQRMGFNNGEAAQALFVSKNTITEFRRIGATAGKTLVMMALELGAAHLSMRECIAIGKVNRAAREARNELEAIPGL